MTQLGHCEIADEHNKSHTIRDLERKSGFLLRSPIDRSTTVHCYSACITATGKLANKGSHVAFKMDDKVCVL